MYRRNRKKIQKGFLLLLKPEVASVYKISFAMNSFSQQIHGGKKQ